MMHMFQNMVYLLFHTKGSIYVFAQKRKPSQDGHAKSKNAGTQYYNICQELQPINSVNKPAKTHLTAIKFFTATSHTKFYFLFKKLPNQQKRVEPKFQHPSPAKMPSNLIPVI